jgi:YidC/Oxa1 family membrane protein insertase
MWDLILNPFITTLTVLYQVLFHDVVLAIIVFTILIRVLTYPLTAQQQRSMKAQQELQPEIRKLQEKYKNDKEKLNQETMRLYREKGINPLGGCLPLLIQLPILIGLYQAITHALAATPLQLIDLSGRFLVPGLDHLVPLNNMWLGMDLTQPPGVNPIYAYSLPVIVLVTSWLQSKIMTPTAPPSNSDEEDKPNQAQAMTQSMTTIMPLMFGFFSLQFSVGLSIYFIVSNIIGIVQYAAQGKVDWRSAIPGLPGRRPVESISSAGGGKASRPKAKAKASKAK